MAEKEISMMPTNKKEMNCIFYAQPSQRSQYDLKQFNSIWIGVLQKFVCEKKIIDVESYFSVTITEGYSYVKNKRSKTFTVNSLCPYGENEQALQGEWKRSITSLMKKLAKTINQETITVIFRPVEVLECFPELS